MRSDDDLPGLLASPFELLGAGNFGRIDLDRAPTNHLDLFVGIGNQGAQHGVPLLPGSTLGSPGSTLGSPFGKEATHPGFQCFTHDPFLKTVHAHPAREPCLVWLATTAYHTRP